MHTFLSLASIAFFLISFATIGGSIFTSVREARAIDKRRERDALSKRIREVSQRDYWR